VGPMDSAPAKRVPRESGGLARSANQSRLQAAGNAAQSNERLSRELEKMRSENATLQRKIGELEPRKDK